MIGQTVSHYKILEKLGEGGMGVVYKAQDTKLKRTVALKFFSPQSLGSKKEKSRFLHEAQAAAALDHSNICTVHEINEVDGHSFIAMAYVDGPSVREEVESGPLDVDRAVDIAIQVADGLRVAHEKKIIHRDIKSANVMLTSKGQAKITDFGLAKLPGRTKLTKTGTAIGTLAYMSPEQARGEEVDHRTDIWSLGIVLYEMLTGTTPFKEDHEAAMAYLIMNEDVTPPSDLTPEVPAELDSIIAKMLQKNPDDRYATTEGLLSDLRKMQTGAAVKVALPMSRKAKRVTWALSAVLVTAAVVMSLIILNRGPSPVDAKTLAVVDFDIIGGDEAPHLAEGLAEGISTKLSKLQSVRVSNSDDIRRLRQKNISAKEVASQLDARYALGGSLLRTGEQIRVTPQLIDASTGDVVWSEPFDREFSNVLDFLDEVSLKIVEVLKIELNPAEKIALKENPTESPEAYEHYLKGRHYYYRVTVSDNEHAEKEFQKALRIDPDYPLALAGLADTYVQRYKERYDYDEYWLDEAEKLIEKALKVENDLAEIYESMAEVYIENKNYLDGLEVARKARDIRPDWDEPYLRLGEIYQYRGERSVAVQMFDKALEICPSVDGWCGKGNVLQTKGLVDSAEMAYKMAVEHNPDHDRPYYDLGRLYYYGVGDLEEAERMARRGIEVRPDRDRSYELLKEVLCYGRGRFQEAEELIRGFVDRYPYNFDAYDHLYDYLQYDKGDLWSARLRVAEDAVARNPDRVWPYLMLASAYADKTGGEAKYEKAVEAVQKALEMRPKSGRVLHGAGAIYAYLGDSEKAHHYYRCAMEASPGNPNILAYMAHLFIGEAHFDSAATVAATLIRQAPGMGYSYNLMGTALTHLMRTDEFLTIMQDAADRYGQDDPWFYVWLGDAWRLSGKFREAADSYSRVLDLKKSGSKVNLDMVQESLRGLGITQWLSGDTDGALASFSEAASTETEGSFTLYEMMVIPLMKYLGRIDEIEVKLNDLRKDGLIDSWIYHAIYYYPSLRQFDGTLRAVEQALDNDEVTFKPWLVMRTAAWYRQKGDFAKAKRILREVEPSVKDNYQEWIDHEWANVEAIRGSLELAIQFARKAYKEVDYSQRNKPISLLSRLYYASGRTRDALDVLAKANGFQGNIDAFYQKAQMALVTQSSDADEELSRAHLLAMRGSRGSDWDWGLGRAHIYAALTSAHIGDEERARSEIEYAIKLEPERADIAYHVAAVYSLLGNTSSALQWLEKSVERGHQELWWARVDPDLDSLRELPRFQEIMSDWDARMRALVD